MSLRRGAEFGASGLLVFVFDRSIEYITARRGCGNMGIAQGFPKPVGAEGTLVLVFLGVHRLSFPQLSSCAAFLPQCGEELMLGCLHETGGFGIAARIGDTPQAFGSDSSLQTAPELWRLLQQFPRRCITAIHPALFALPVGRRFRHATRPMEIQIGIEMLTVEGHERVGVAGIDIAVSDVLADHCAILGLHQAVVVGMPRARFGLFGQQLVQQLGDRAIDELTAIVQAH